MQVLHVDQLSTYKIRLTFSDGASSEIDFEPFLKSSQHPEVRGFLEPDCFAQFALQDGELVWGDYELCFPIADLYDGRI